MIGVVFLVIVTEYLCGVARKAAKRVRPISQSNGR